MALMNELKGGADLTHPKASVGWMAGAMVAVVLLAVAVGVGMFLYAKVKSLTGLSKISGASLSDQSGMGSGSVGWL